MKKSLQIVSLVILIPLITSCSSHGQDQQQAQNTTDLSGHLTHLNHITYISAMSDTSSNEKVSRTAEEWRKLLSSEEYRILRRQGTEIPWINEYNSHYEEGVYVCRGCGQPLFHSDTKYNSRSGWPSYWAPIRENAVSAREDNSFFMKRTETICSRCESHLGHVFDDGPEPTGLRYCMNSAALKFIPKNDSEN